jgi:hypothetical protein
MKTLLLTLILSALLVSNLNADSLPAPGTTEGLGVNIGFVNDPNQVEKIRVSGSKFVRMDLRWNQVESTKGTYNFAGFNKLYADCAARGIRIVTILDYGNNLYGTDARSPEWQAGYANFAAAAAKNFKGRTNIYEIYNEPNSATNGLQYPDTYTTVAKKAITAMRREDPKCTVIGPAISWMRDTFYQRKCFEAGLLNYLDAVSVHGYRASTVAPETVVSDYATTRSLMQTYGGRTLPIVCSEWGYSTGATNAPATSNGALPTAQLQADYLARSFLVNMSEGIRVSIWYSWWDWGTDPNEFEKNFGVLENDFSPKPAYNALKLLTTSLRGTTYSNRINDGNPSDWLLVFKSPNGHESLAAWTTGDAHTANVPGWGSLSLSSTPLYVNPVPEPTAFVILLSGLFASCGVFAICRRRPGARQK